ncbi:MAG TPA: hypothetical protein PLZ45_07540 [Ferruginibacter sp.]|nr:hypothetical protein [Ferruginibacter sp.]
MKKDLHLTASVDQPEMMENIIGQLAAREHTGSHSNNLLLPSWKAVDTSSVESYISGRIEFDYNETQRIRIPYITSFLFCCTTLRKNEYALHWSVSLS